MKSQKEKDKEPSLADLLAELMNSGKRQIFIWEYAVIYPVTNQSQILHRGINDMVKAKNFVSASSLLRSLIESVMSLVYALSIPKEDELKFYNEFMENGRLRRWSKSKKKWDNVRDDHLIKNFEEVTELNIRETYNKLCNILHFSTDHMYMMHSQYAKPTKQFTSSIKISGEGPDLPESAYSQITKMSDNLIYVIKRSIAAEIHHKRRKAGEPVSEIAASVLKASKVIYAK